VRRGRGDLVTVIVEFFLITCDERVVRADGGDFEQQRLTGVLAEWAVEHQLDRVERTLLGVVVDELDRVEASTRFFKRVH